MNWQRLGECGEQGVRRGIRVDAESEILGHLARFDSGDASGLEGISELAEASVAIELGAVGEATRPGKDGGDGVGGGLLALLVHAVVARDGAVGGLGLDGLAVRRDQHRGHQTKRAKALRDRVGLHITVVVFAGPDVAAVGLHGKGYHVVNEAVLVPDLGALELGLVLLLVDLREDILETTIVLLQDGVLGRQIQGPTLLQRVLEARLSELTNRLIRVVHAHQHASAALEVEHLEGLLLTIFRSVHNLELAGTNNDVRSAVLISESVATDHNGLGPTGDQAGDVLDHDGLTEDSSAQNVTDGTVGGLPHLLQLEL